MTTVFLVNPASANGTTGRSWPELERRAAAAGLVGEVLLSDRRGRIAELARAAALGGAERLVVVGGDGTVNEAVNGLAGIDNPPELAIVPRGTGWDLARTFALPRRIEDAARVALHGEVATLDLGRCSFRASDGSTRESRFANVASVGMSGAIAERANETTKALGGKVSYLVATLRVFGTWRAASIRLTVDGETREARMLDVIVANGRFVGGGMMMCPAAATDDGLFDVVTIGDLSKPDLLRTIPKVYRGAHLPHPKAEVLRGAVVTIDADRPLPIQLDGEQPGTTPVRFEIIPRALRLRVPAPI